VKAFTVWLSGVVGRLSDRTLRTERALSQSRFEDVVKRYYQPLYQFALSLTHTAPDAADMTQQAFYLWATKGHQLRDVSKVKTWLFTTLHREFLRVRRQEQRFPHYELEDVYLELPSVEPLMVDNLDATRVLQALARLPAPYKAPVTLFYLGEHSYKEIAHILEVPVGTVQSRIARGKSQLQRMLTTLDPPVVESSQERR
jgi:RNA polymerase sigma-70 factor (ECF subfamily)